jgi:hypothetical protein
MNDRDVKSALSEFARVLKPNGALVLHVKNLSSLYLFSLWVGKQVKLLLGKTTKLCYYRSFRWYVEALKSAGFEIAEYNSFNVCIVPRMPIRVVAFLQRVEFRNYKTRFFQSSFIRRHGSDLKIKAKRR